MLWPAVYSLKDELTSKQPLDACAAIPVPEIAHPQQIELAVTLLTCTRSSLQVLLGKLTSFMSFCYCKIHKQVENECNFFFSLADYSPQLELTFSARCNSVLINGNMHSEKTRANFQKTDPAGVEKGEESACCEYSRQRRGMITTETGAWRLFSVEKFASLPPRQPARICIASGRR